MVLIARGKDVFHEEGLGRIKACFGHSKVIARSNFTIAMSLSW